MQQAIHIFKKDIRGLSFQIALTLLFVVAFIATSLLNGPADTLGPFLIVAWWALIGRLIQTDGLVGNYQFWCTRPYKWSSLLIAKLLFVLAFVNLPMLISDIVIISAHGFSPFSLIPGLRWTQVLLTTVIVLPVFALSTIVSGLPQLFSALLGLGIVLLISGGGNIGLTTLAPWGPFDWVRSYTVIGVSTVFAAVIIFWQYSQRTTVRNRLLAIAAVALVFLIDAFMPWTAAFGMQAQLSDHSISAPSINIFLDTSQRWLARSIWRDNNQPADVQFPLRISGVPANMTSITEGIQLSMQAPDGTVWQSKLAPPSQFDMKAGILSTQALVEASFYRKFWRQPITIHGKVYLTLTGNAHDSEVPFGTNRVLVSDAGVCSASKEDLGVLGSGVVGGGYRFINPTPLHTYSYKLFCDSAFRSPAGFISAFNENSDRNLFRDSVSYSPFPAQFGLLPTSRYFATTNSTTNLQTAPIVVTKPLAFVTKDFDLKDIRLSDFEPGKGGIIFRLH